MFPGRFANYMEYEPPAFLGIEYRVYDRAGAAVTIAAAGLTLAPESTGDAGDATEQLCQALLTRGRQVLRVEQGAGFAQMGEHRFTVRAGERQDYAQVLQRIDRVHGPLTDICHVWNLDAVSKPEDDDQTLECGFFGLIALAQALGAANGNQVRITVVADDLEDVTGDEPLQVAKATLHGACKVIPLADIRLAFGMDATETTIDSRIVVIELHRETVGFTVDRVLRVVKIPPSDVEPHPVVHSTELEESIERLAKANGRMSRDLRAAAKIQETFLPRIGPAALYGLLYALLQMEQNALAMPVDTPLLVNRALWLAFGFAVVVGGLLVIATLDFIRDEVARTAVAANAGPLGILVVVVGWTFSLLQIALLVRVFSSWFRLNPFSRGMRIVYGMTEWMLRPLRQLIPPIGGLIDLSPLIAYFALGLLEGIVLRAI